MVKASNAKEAKKVTFGPGNFLFLFLKEISISLLTFSCCCGTILSKGKHLLFRYVAESGGYVQNCQLHTKNEPVLLRAALLQKCGFFVANLI